jgi:hypothetical protein
VKYITRNSAGIKVSIGKLNSGMDLSGDTNSPHLLGLGISNAPSGIIPVGQE